MRIDIYFETPSKFGGNSYAELVAQFGYESLYTACYPMLEKLAKKERMIVTESIKEDIDLNDDYPEDEEDGGAVAPAMWGAT